MIKPQNLITKIFLDSGDPDETKKTLQALGFLDGQTTNPSLISKNPEIAKRLNNGEKLTEKEALDFYKDTVQKVSQLLPEGSVSIEVIADLETTKEAMITQAREMFSWIPNAYVKLPTTIKGLEAAEVLLGEGIRINFTLCFSLSQAAAIFKVAENAMPSQVFISPFVGRLDDKGENGMDVVKNCIRLKREVNSNVEILAASIRNLDHVYAAISFGSDILTAPLKVISEWIDKGVRSDYFEYHPKGLREIAYEKFDMTKSWRDFKLYHPLTEAGIKKFSDDWNTLIAS